MRVTTRLILVILVMAIAESAWALYAGKTGLDLLLFYAVLVVASAVFFIPGIVEKSGGSFGEHPAGTARIKR